MALERPDRFYITTPIYYVNDVPHIGHTNTTLLADVLARYHRLLGVPTHFLTGTDEHGQKVYDAATKEGITAQAQCDRTVVRYQDLWKRLGMTNDDFIRTTEDRHKAVVTAILEDLYARDEIYRGEYEGWYCVREERFFTEKELVDGKSPDGNPVEKIVEPNYFFRMSAYQEWLIETIKSNPGFIQPDFRRNETLGFLQKPLGDLCISRPKSRLPWGIELPWDRDFVCYVWFDALVNYISAVGYSRDPETFDTWWPASIHLIGKDILTTHTVYWPTMLHAIGLEVPRTIFAHGWWLTGGAKMSKSLGNVTDPMEMAERHGVDALRYFLMAEMTLGQDATFTEDAFVVRYNADLANDLGNLVSRVLRMIERNLDGRIPEPVDSLDGEEEAALREACRTAVEAMESHLVSMSLDRGIAKVIDAVRAANRYFDRLAPWTLAKAGKTEALRHVIYTSAEALRIISGLLTPVIPEKMARLRRSLGLVEAEIEPRLSALKTWGELEAGRPIGEFDALFPRIVRPKEASMPPESEAPSPKKKADATELLDFSEFAKLKLRVATVVEAERVENADRLLKLIVDLGDQRRQIVAGIASTYSPDEIVGKSVVVVANLKPAKIRGVESNGMLLAASTRDEVRVLVVDGELPPGTRVS